VLSVTINSLITALTSIHVLIRGVLKIGSDSVFKTKQSKNLTSLQMVFRQKPACNPQFKLKVTEITLLAFIVQIKNVSKHDQNKRQGAYKFGKMKFPEFSRPSKQSFPDNYKVKT